MMSEIEETIFAGHDAHRADLAHYWARLMWYRDELWRITTPVWTVYGAFIASCIGFVWSTDKGQVSGPVALMLIAVIALFSWVILRVYWIYANCIYVAIKELNMEIQKREQHIYDEMLKRSDWKADYGRFRVYPELNVLFSIVGAAMMSACMFMVAASVGFDFNYQPADKSITVSSTDIRSMLELCFGLLVLFELVLMKFKKHCKVCDV